MRFLTFDELTPSMDADRLLVHLSALGGAADRRAVALWRRRSNLYADYVGVFAVERGQVVGQTLVKRLSYTFPEGTETIGAIASVGTRPDRARAGVARQILTEVHRREREAGVRFVALWTNLSWGAHHLYEKLGYRDVYAFPWAVRPPGRTVAPSPVRHRARPARPSDLAELERFHALRARGRIGFCQRPVGSFRISAATKEFDPARELIVVRDGRSVTGYALAQYNASRTTCGEMLVSSDRARASLVTEIERRAKGTAVAFHMTPVSDAPKFFRRRGYVTLTSGWYVFMAAPLQGEWTVGAAIAKFAPDDPRFLCMLGDRF
ncbi:MAG: GNAT family N-acetyltransferase [Thermoplasmata archaeon]|nr:GNAT family N-acetyltransferase [Thermoplasmata archaeon]